MSSEQINPFWRTFRARLAIWNAVAVFLTGALTLITVREGVRRALLHELDLLLRADADDFLRVRLRDKLTPEEFGKQWAERPHARLPGTEFAQLLDARDVVLWASTHAETPAESARPRIGEAYNWRRFRIVEAVEQTPGEEQVTVRLAASLGAIEADMARIDQLTFLTGFVLILVAPVGGYLLAAQAMRPLVQMISTAQGLKPGMMEHRLYIRGTGDELDSLAGVINGLLDRIDDYFRTSRDLLADAAHQLRTPLAAIRSSLEVLLAREGPSEEEREILLQIVDESNSLETLVNQMLLLAETEGNRSITIHGRVQLDELIRQSLDMFEAVAETLGVTLRAGAIIPSAVLGRRHYLRQVINNLIENALKFTAAKNEAGPRTVTVSLTQEPLSGLTNLRVADTGVGIGEEHVSHIFERFYRADPVRAREGISAGNGLGLSIVRAVVESHGGKVKVESKLGVGTTFTVSLPLAEDGA